MQMTSNRNNPIESLREDWSLPDTLLPPSGRIVRIRANPQFVTDRRDDMADAAQTPLKIRDRATGANRSKNLLRHAAHVTARFQVDE